MVIKTEFEAGYDLAAQGITQGKGRGGAVKYEKAIQDQIEKRTKKLRMLQK
jgi:hypothetical protein